jgi:hypothetical protein
MGEVMEDIAVVLARGRCVTSASVGLSFLSSKVSIRQDKHRENAVFVIVFLLFYGSIFEFI